MLKMNADRGSWRTRAAALVAVCLAAVACRRGPESAAAPEVGFSTTPDIQVAADKRGLTVLVVEDRTFTNADFIAYVEALGVGREAELDAESLSRLFDRFVEEKLLLAAARKQGVTSTAAEQQAYLEKLADAGAAQKAEAAPTEDSLLDRLLVEKYTALIFQTLRVEDAEIAAYYEEHKKDFLLPERYKVSQILLPTEDRAVEVLQRLAAAPEAEFRRIAAAESVGPEAAKGGEMGLFKAGDLPTDMEKTIFALQEGRLSQVFESSYGYHIFRLDRRFPPQLLTLEEAAPAIRARLVEEKTKEALARHLEELRATLTWNQRTDDLFFIYQRNAS